MGKVTLLSPSLDAMTRRATLELEIDNAAGKLLANMFAHVDIAVGKLPGVLVVSRDAVYEAAGGVEVFRIRDGRVQAVRPKLGPVDGDRVAVLEGLAEGDEVAVSALAGLSDGAPVRVAAAQALNAGAK